MSARSPGSFGDAGSQATRLMDAASVRDTADRLANEARRALWLLSPDLEPAVYDRRPFLSAVRALAIARAAHGPVRVLCQDPAGALRRGHRLIELARRLSSAIEIRVWCDEETAAPDPVLIADTQGFLLRDATDPQIALLERDPAAVRWQRRRFHALWERAEPAIALRRLYL